MLNGHLNYVGVEYEFECDRSITGLRESLRKLDSFQDFTTDGSLSSTGREYITQPLKIDLKLSDSLNQIEHILRPNSHVDIRCGLHIHLNVGNWGPDELQMMWEFYYKIQNNLTKMVARSRVNNEYCERLPPYNRELSFEANLYDGDEYRIANKTGHKYDPARDRIVNFHDFDFEDRRSVEVRLHQGTVKAKKVYNWIMINKNLMKYAVTSNDYSLSLANFLSVAGGKDIELERYIKKRMDRFYPGYLVQNGIKSSEPVENILRQKEASGNRDDLIGLEV